jgi:hypothetical protein
LSSEKWNKVSCLQKHKYYSSLYLQMGLSRVMILVLNVQS